MRHRSRMLLVALLATVGVVVGASSASAANHYFWNGSLGAKGWGTDNVGHHYSGLYGYHNYSSPAILVCVKLHSTNGVTEWELACAQQAVGETVAYHDAFGLVQNGYSSPATVTGYGSL